MMKALYEKGFYSHDKLGPLVQFVKDCDRHDLVRYIDEYRQRLNSNSQIKTDQGEGVSKCTASLTQTDQETENGPGPSKRMKLSNTNSELTVSEIMTEYKNASVHGVIVRLSPIRLSKKNIEYFAGELTDGHKTVRFVCYIPALRPKVKEMCVAKTSVVIQNCKICQSTYDGTRGNFELESNKEMKVFQSSKTFNIRDGAVYTHSAVLAKLEDFKNKVKGACLTVSGKIVSVKDACEVQRNDGVQLTLKECKLADSSMTVTLNVWEGEIDKVEQDSCYRFINVKKEKYDGQYYLTTTEESEINEIGDIGEISSIELPSTHREVSGEIFAVAKVLKYKKCAAKKCFSKVDSQSGRCTQCDRKNKLALCEDEICVHFSIKVRDETTQAAIDYDVTAFKRVLDQMVENGMQCTAPESEIEGMLLDTQPMTFVIDQENIVAKVHVATS